MASLSASELLGLWECGHGLRPAGRALSLISAARPEDSAAEAAELSVGGRDAELIAIRERAFGSRLVGVTSCRRCGERLELDVDTNQIRMTPTRAPAAELVVTVDDAEVRFRVPSAADLLEIEELDDVAAARAALLARCVRTACERGRSVRVGELRKRVLAAVAERMAEADPQADVRLAVRCPACGAESEEMLDIGSFFWSELESWARRLLRDVHELARAYGWTEEEVLRLSSHRRAAYLELVSG
jgi:hypothetical protein